jgi:hypothetical protein
MDKDNGRKYDTNDIDGALHLYRGIDEKPVCSHNKKRFPKAWMHMSITLNPSVQLCIIKAAFRNGPAHLPLLSAGPYCIQN